MRRFKAALSASLHPNLEAHDKAAPHAAGGGVSADRANQTLRHPTKLIALCDGEAHGRGGLAG
ncbi:MAG: hypothetical protein ABSF28_16795 [Terracidiphilus sp.]|jgi:hypothetical protein